VLFIAKDGYYSILHLLIKLRIHGNYHFDNKTLTLLFCLTLHLPILPLEINAVAIKNKLTKIKLAMFFDSV